LSTRWHFSSIVKGHQARLSRNELVLRLEQFEMAHL
jgi:hypothetical protein